MGFIIVPTLNMAAKRLNQAWFEKQLTAFSTNKNHCIRQEKWIAQHFLLKNEWISDCQLMYFKVKSVGAGLYDIYLSDKPIARN